MGTSTIPPRPVAGYMERHRVVTAVSAVLLMTLVGVLVGTGVALVLATVAKVAASVFATG